MNGVFLAGHIVPIFYADSSHCIAKSFSVEELEISKVKHSRGVILVMNTHQPGFETPWLSYQCQALEVAVGRRTGGVAAVRREVFQMPNDREPN